jgi:hypothetical protein
LFGRYTDQGASDPLGPIGREKGASARVMRGGSFDDDAGDLRAAARNWRDPGSRNSGIGFGWCPPVFALDPLISELSDLQSGEAIRPCRVLRCVSSISHTVSSSSVFLILCRVEP